MSATKRVNDRARRHAEYWRRKEAQLCVDCEAGLQDDDGVKCVDCAERDTAWVPSKAAKVSKYERVKAYRVDHAARGLCISCPSPAANGTKRCAVHLAADSKATAAHRARKVQGVTVLATAARKLSAPRELPYVPIDELLATARARILLALRRRDWLTSLEVGEILDESDEAKRALLYKTMGRLVAEGLVQSRGVSRGRHDGEYRISAKGIEQADAYRAGRMPMRKISEAKKEAA